MKSHCFHPFLSGHKSTCSIPWPVCCRCGLMKLSNAATQAAVRAGCRGRED